MEENSYRVVEDAAMELLGYKQINNLLCSDEEISETHVVGDNGEYLALTNNNRLILVSHWYGESNNIRIANVARTVRYILNSDDELSTQFSDFAKKLIDRHYFYKHMNTNHCISDRLRTELEHLIGYVKNNDNYKRDTPDKLGHRNNEKKNEYVYFLTADNGLTKIGRTINLDARIHHFTTKLPYELTETLILSTSNSSFLESELHNLFSDKRIRGEWFDIDNKDIENIKNKFELDIMTSYTVYKDNINSRALPRHRERIAKEKAN